MWPLTMSGGVCDFEASPALIVTKKTLTVQKQNESKQRTNLFHTKAGMQGKSVKVIIDGGSCHNLASQELCDKLGLILFLNRQSLLCDNKSGARFKVTNPS